MEYGKEQRREGYAPRGGQTQREIWNWTEAFINSEGSHLFLCYNAIKGDQQTMSSGYARKPVFVQPFQFAEDGWLVGTATPTEGWTAPRFE